MADVWSLHPILKHLSQQTVKNEYRISFQINNNNSRFCTRTSTKVDAWKTPEQIFAQTDHFWGPEK